MATILLSVSIALTVVGGIVFAVARVLFPKPIEFDPYDNPDGWEERQ